MVAILNLLSNFREKSKLKTRDEAWNKIEELAQHNPHFQEMVNMRQRASISLDLAFNLSDDVSSPNDDFEDISYEKFETEAKEVSLLSIFEYLL